MLVSPRGIIFRDYQVLVLGRDHMVLHLAIGCSSVTGSGEVMIEHHLRLGGDGGASPIENKHSTFRTL